MRKRGFEKEIKKKVEHTLAAGMQAEWNVEWFREVGNTFEHVVRIRFLATNVTSVIITKNDAQRTLQHGDVTILVDGIVHSELEGQWQKKPLFYFLRALYDKYIYKVWTEREDAAVRKHAYDLHQALKDYFARYQF